MGSQIAATAMIGLVIGGLLWHLSQSRDKQAKALEETK